MGLFGVCFFCGRVVVSLGLVDVAVAILYVSSGFIYNGSRQYQVDSCSVFGGGGISMTR